MERASHGRRTGLAPGLRVGLVDVVTLGAVVIVVGLVVIVIEAHVSTGGLLGLVGVLAVAAGVGLIMASAGAPLAVTVPVAVVIAVVGVAAVLLVARKVLVARRQAPRTGAGALVGTVATVHTWGRGEGQVALEGTLWRAVLGRGWQDDAYPEPGEAVVVEALDGLTLLVGPQHARGR